MNITREMIAAAHDVTMQHKIVLGHELLTEIYQAMDAKREFVGLTDEAVWSLYKNLWMFHPAEEPRLAGDILKFARAIEAKLKDKNGY